MCTVPTIGSPTTSEPCSHVNVPTTLSFLSIASHCTMPSFESEMAASKGMAFHQSSRRPRYSVSTACTSGVVSTSLRKAGASSRCASGSTRFSSTSLSAPGAGQ